MDTSAALYRSVLASCSRATAYFYSSIDRLLQRVCNFLAALGFSPTGTPGLYMYLSGINIFTMVSHWTFETNA